jgi:hypothetical protein
MLIAGFAKQLVFVVVEHFYLQSGGFDAFPVSFNAHPDLLEFEIKHPELFDNNEFDQYQSQ